MVNWREAYSEPSKTSNVGHFPKLVNNWMPLICFTKNSVLDVWKGSEYVLTAWKVNCKVYITTRHPLEMLNVIGFLRTLNPVNHNHNQKVFLGNKLS